MTLVLAIALVAPSHVGAQPPQLIPPPSYYRPVIVDGFTFPIARTNWMSVIELAPDWHDPRFRLISGEWKLAGIHEGNDMIAEKGTPILSLTSGTVEAVGWTFYSGLRVGVRGDDGKYYFYAHTSRIADGISPGTAVEPGTVLAAVGNTGYGDPGHEDEFPPHLHIGIEGPGGWENPYPLVRRLYLRSVAVTTRRETELSALGRSGDQAGFDRLARKLYEDLSAGME